MLNDALEALAASAGTAVVAAMVTDGWQETRTRVARLLSHGDACEEERQRARLERTRAELTASPGEQARRVRQRQDTVWRLRFADLLEDTPDAEAELRDLMAFLGVAPSAVAASVRVDAHASGEAQQAVLGQGVQHNTFNDRRR